MADKHATSDVDMSTSVQRILNGQEQLIKGFQVLIGSEDGSSGLLQDIVNKHNALTEAQSRDHSALAQLTSTQERHFAELSKKMTHMENDSNQKFNDLTASITKLTTLVTDAAHAQALANQASTFRMTTIETSLNAITAKQTTTQDKVDTLEARILHLEKMESSIIAIKWVIGGITGILTVIALVKGLMGGASK